MRLDSPSSSATPQLLVGKSHKLQACALLKAQTYLLRTLRIVVLLNQLDVRDLNDALFLYLLENLL